MYIVIYIIVHYYISKKTLSELAGLMYALSDDLFPSFRWLQRLYVASGRVYYIISLNFIDVTDLLLREK
jgi:hypothetical protein